MTFHLVIELARSGNLDQVQAAMWDTPDRGYVFIARL